MDLEYNINTNGKILVWICSQTFPLGLSNLKTEEDKKEVKKTLEEDKETGGKRDIDLNEIKQFFKEGNFPAPTDVRVQNNPSFENFKSKLKELDRALDEYQCFVFVFLTYSKFTQFNEESNDEVLHFNDRTNGLVPQAKIIDEVKNLNVTKGKPKIFLIQADDLSLLKDKVTFKSDKMEPQKVIKIPTDADQLIIKSTIPQRIANKHDAATPSFLIQAFLEAMENKKEKEDLLTLTTTINKHVADLITKSGDNRKDDMHVPLVTSTLTKLLFLQANTTPEHVIS